MITLKEIEAIGFKQEAVVQIMRLSNYYIYRLGAEPNLRKDVKQEYLLELFSFKDKAEFNPRIIRKCIFHNFLKVSGKLKLEAILTHHNSSDDGVDNFMLDAHASKYCNDLYLTIDKYTLDIERALKKLKPKEAQFLHDYFWDELGEQELCKKYNLKGSAHFRRQCIKALCNKLDIDTRWMI